MANQLSISNIAWKEPQDADVYGFMKELGYTGLEVAPTRIFAKQPYEHLEDAGQWAAMMRRKWGFDFPSLQSIWYGRSENMFASTGEREILLSYTKEAICFAEKLGCHNLVFGCPRNRNVPEGADVQVAIAFFRELGEYALIHSTAIGMEGTPAIYNTNYINGTKDALALIKEVGCEGFRLNLDMGTMVQNEEDAAILKGNVQYVNHVHISEPGLKALKPRPLHAQIMEILKSEGYHGDISIEMGCQEETGKIYDAMKYVRDLYERVM